MGRVEGKVALVTGGALGIGRACALLLSREGAKVVVTDIKEEEGQAVTAEITAAGGAALFVRHNVADENEWRQVIDRTLQEFGRLDILVNNAGIGQTNTVVDDTLEKWRFLMSINLDGVFLGTKYGIEAMRKNGERGGSIINMSSILGLVGEATAASYNASKGGVRLLTKSAALHCARSGWNIRVNSVHPGYIVTPMVQGAMEASGAASAMETHLVSLHPLGHLGEPDDIAYGVLYLAADESKFVTGSELVIDGGYTAQ
jgi:NAD(P)-dependent dehydrogenase (short-subunit alcohol dehydrogenase family)